MSHYKYTELIRMVTDLLVCSGFPVDRAQITAETLVEADLMGHYTHGLALIDPYLKDVAKGGMKMQGEPEVVRDTGASITWNGDYMSGPWLVQNAMELGFDRIKHHPVVTISIAKSHHIGCLAAYPEQATRRNLMMLLSCSDPLNETVAPFGGTKGIYSPNPLAIGIPTQNDPIIIDISMSTTANGLVNLKKKKGEKLPYKWLLKPDGQPTDDPNSFFENPPSTILPLGGMESGYKGFGLGLLIEMLTSGLAGHGRADHPTQWGASVFIQLIDPQGFGGTDAFNRQAQYLVDACLGSEPLDPQNPVRIPGSRALRLREKRKKEGIPLSSDIIDSLKAWAEKLDFDISRYLSDN